ncbi:hypothetical protein [Porphyromonas levii]|uniref:hypothetical protein n=1 Tax=Porphyromonas levii TaxID=28114 RepID=UPI001B8C6943|nr:hypothetical protein [Porphyromonas levii]
MTSKEITEMYYAYVFDLNKDVVLEIAPKCAEGEFLVIKRLAPPSNIPHLFFHLFAPFGFYRYSLIDSKSGEEAAYVSTIRWNPQFDFIHRFGGGLHIGPDATKEKYRGRSFHPYLISYVLREQQTNKEIGNVICLSSKTISPV